MAKARVGECLPLFLPISKTTITPPANETDPVVNAETGASILAFLAARLRQGHAASASLQQLIEQLDLPPVVSSGLRVEGETVVLSPAATGTVGSITTLLPVLAAMHAALHGYQPIFLIDMSEMHLKGEEQADLLDFLLDHCAHQQILVIPDTVFLELATLKSAREEAAEQALLKIIALPPAG